MFPFHLVLRSAWMWIYNLKLNPDRTHVIQVNRAFSLKIVGSGTSLDPGCQLLDVVKSTYVQLRLMSQLYPLLQTADLARMTHNLVTSCLNYCNVLWVRFPLKSVQKLQLIQSAVG